MVEAGPDSLYLASVAQYGSTFPIEEEADDDSGNADSGAEPEVSYIKDITFMQIHHFDSLGAKHWTLSLE